MQEITITVTLDEANLLLEALGEMPFKKVYPLVSKIQEQAATQLGQNGQETLNEIVEKDG